MLSETSFKLCLAMILFGSSCISVDVNKEEPKEKPNIVIIIADDLGIGDLGCYGNTSIKTPNIDRLAKEGVILEHHLSAAGLCTPSRAALMTGRYPARFGLIGVENSVPVIAHVASRAGLPRDETTIAEALRKSGYTTGAVGKWHLGSGCEAFGRNCLSALNYGFSTFFGLPATLIQELKPPAPFWVFDFSDRVYQTLLGTAIATALMIVYCVKKGHCKLALFLTFCGLIIFPIIWFLYTHYRFYTSRYWQVSDWMNQNFNGVIMHNGTVIHQRVPFEILTEEFVNESIKFMTSHAKDEEPFFLYHSFGHVHVPMFTSRKNEHRSVCGRYGDNVEEMDDGVGSILTALQELKIEQNTIVYFVSDHGGHIEALDPVDGQRVGGFNKQFKGGKGMGAPEGAIRVPGIFRWPKVFTPDSRLAFPTSMLDILPTVLELAGLPPLQNIVSNAKTLDGISFANRLRNPSIELKQEKRILIHHCRRAIQALRLITDSKIYKMYLFLHRWKENSTQCGWGLNTYCGCYGDDIIDVTDFPIVYELNSDPFEDHPINNGTEEYTRVVKELMNYLGEWRKNVSYPPSILQSRYDTMLLPWLQPFNLFS